MKRVWKRTLAVLLAVVMIGSGLPWLVSAEDKGSKNVGDIIEFGSYPQSKVTDSSTLQQLNEVSLKWKSYRYYSGKNANGTMVPGDWMEYDDVEYPAQSGQWYRAVRFSEYRPFYTFEDFDEPYADTQSQKENGYYKNTTYWFKFEPLKWRVLDPGAGLVMCEDVIDAQSFTNTIYGKEVHDEGTYTVFYNDPEYKHTASNYETSSIRLWLQDTFLNWAFDDSEKNNIAQTRFPDTPEVEFDYDNTVFLLSYDDLKNPEYGFSSDPKTRDVNRTAIPSDYALCQGAALENPEYYNLRNTYWLLRYREWFSNEISMVYPWGSVFWSSIMHMTRLTGIRPAMRLKVLGGNTNSPDPVIRIHNYAASRTVDYRTTITFSADEIQNPVPDAQIYWFINGQNKGSWSTYTQEDVKNDFNVQAKYMKDGIVLAESETETVKVNTGFFARLKAFFRALFGRLPNVVQEYCGAEILDKMLP